MSFCCVFPGQGSQSLKMMDELIDLDIVQAIFAQAKELTNIDYLAMLQQDTSIDIDQTTNTQPLMLISGYATYLAWQHQSQILPSIVAGHSLGEFTALVVAGILSFPDALNLVIKRAQYMQQAMPIGAGAMAAILGLADEILVTICQQVSRDSSLVVAGVNFNAPGQVVIAGDKLAVEMAIEELKKAGAKKAILLSVSVPSHTPLMLGAGDQLAQAFEEVSWHEPTIKVMQNYNAKVSDNLVEIKNALVKQIYSPVLWSKSINNIVDLGIVDFIECGPGGVLSGLNKRINSNIHSYSLHKRANWAEINII